MDNYDQQFIARDVELVNRYEFYEATAASQNVLSSSTRDLVAPPIEFPGRTWSGTNHFDTPSSGLVILYLSAMEIGVPLPFKVPPFSF